MAVADWENRGPRSGAPNPGRGGGSIAEVIRNRHPQTREMAPTGPWNPQEAARAQDLVQAGQGKVKAYPAGQVPGAQGPWGWESLFGSQNNPWPYPGKEGFLQSSPQYQLGQAMQGQGNVADVVRAVHQQLQQRQMMLQLMQQYGLGGGEGGAAGFTPLGIQQQHYGQTPLQPTANIQQQHYGQIPLQPTAQIWQRPLTQQPLAPTAFSQQYYPTFASPNYIPAPLHPQPSPSPWTGPQPQAGLVTQPMVPMGGGALGPQRGVRGY